MVDSEREKNSSSVGTIYLLQLRFAPVTLGGFDFMPQRPKSWGVYSNIRGDVCGGELPD